MRRSSERGRSGLAGPLLFAAAVAVGALAVLGWQRATAASRLPAAAPPAAGALTVADMPAQLPAARLPKAFVVGILRDSASDRYYAAAGYMDSVRARWRAVLADMGAVPRELRPDDALAARDLDVLVVPSSPCLGRESRHAIDGMLARGGGVVLTWLAGVRDGGCRSVGYGLLANLTSASRADTLDSRQRDAYVTLLGDGPLTAGIPPGSRLELLVANHVALRAPDREAYYSDYTLNPRGAAESELLDAAMVAATHGSGRAVYLGFELTSVSPTPWNDGLVRVVARNAVAWAAGTPSARILPWPHARRAAAIIAQDVEDQFRNARYAVDSLRAAGVPGTYFVVSRLAERNEALTRAMAEQGEVGSHSSRHRAFNGLSEREQLARLEETQDQLASILGGRVAGFRPPQEQFDLATLEQWLAAGGRYFFGTNNSRSASPEILTVSGKPLVLFGRVSNDDFISIQRAGHTDVRQLANEYIDALEKARALGGAFILSYHSQLLARPELVPALATVARHVAADTTLWPTTAGQAAAWWLRRASLETSASRVDDERVRLTVANTGRERVEGAVAEVMVDDRRLLVALPPLEPRARWETVLAVGESAGRGSVASAR